KNKARSSDGIKPEEIALMYKQLTQWCTTGICLTIRQGAGIKSNETTLVLKKDEWKPLFPFLPLLKEIIPEDIMNGPYGGFINGFLDFFIKTLNDPESVVEFGICIDNHIELPDQE
ncbi:MAG: hypothetical protein PUB21_07460, partial [Bacteroidales bacterium]|nr:hypothetical protein [Bacteroidales bacterium]